MRSEKNIIWILTGIINVNNEHSKIFIILVKVETT